MFRHVHLYSLGSLIFIIALFLSPITANHSLGESTNHNYNPQSDFVTQETNPAATDSSKQRMLSPHHLQPAFLSTMASSLDR